MRYIHSCKPYALGQNAPETLPEEPCAAAKSAATKSKVTKKAKTDTAPSDSATIAEDEGAVGTLDLQSLLDDARKNPGGADA